jgi:hypothetical protein
VLVSEIETKGIEILNNYDNIMWVYISSKKSGHSVVPYIVLINNEK